MIKKIRLKPIYMNKLQLLMNRLEDDLVKQNLELEIGKMTAGFRGEDSINYFLNMLPNQKECHVLHDLRIPHESTFFQIDTLILNPTYMLIIEVKNISGNLFFDHTFNQLIRTKNGIEEPFQDPIAQVERQKYQLEHWLSKNKFPSVPIEALVVMTHSQSVLKTNDESSRISKKVIHSVQLLDRIRQLQRKYKQHVIVAGDVMNKITRRLIKEHTPRDVDVMERYRISKEMIIKGVQCEGCLGFGMKKGYRTWNCPHCSHTSRNPHIKALKDYSLFIQTTITNQQARDFLKLSSISVASKLLVSMKLPYTGVTRGRTYDLSSLNDLQK
ncbi:NERD domain-containing protein [Fictibacillus sp. 23RED33]|uniref:nuclease-related domain-containing protein n=1 Tax=Fictibacillus sp. 23RED33 TaxID=2745879 RepID=UPI0018CC89C9|nr:nuclease-related domain-containing protein [Fictibacillus sp. 23RED33]MBH0175393.1 NERD domain-containing protein [Fictibacillus sp. 23RED33]